MTSECPRCGGLVKHSGRTPSKTPFCQPCASTLSNRKRWAQKWPVAMFQRVKPRTQKHVTLPKGWQ